MTCTEQFTRLADKMESLGADNWTAAFAAGAAVQYGKTEEMMKFLEERTPVTVAELNAKRDSIIREHYLNMRADEKRTPIWHGPHPMKRMCPLTRKMF